MLTHQVVPLVNRITVGSPCKDHDHVRMDSLQLNSDGLCVACVTFCSESLLRCKDCRCANSPLQIAPCWTCKSHNERPEFQEIILTTFAYQFQSDSRTCSRCRRWNARRRKIQRSKIESPIICRGRATWSRLDKHTQRRTLHHFDKLHQSGESVTLSSLSCAMPNIVWRLTVEDLRDVWNVYRYVCISISLASRVILH